MKQKLLGFAGAAWASACLSFGMVPPAHADAFPDGATYNWLYGNVGGVTPLQSGSGTITTGPELKLTPGAARITSITGTWNGYEIKPTTPLDLFTFGDNENKFYYSILYKEYLDILGFAFSDTNGDKIDIFYNKKLGVYRVKYSENVKGKGYPITGTSTGTFAIQFVPPPPPPKGAPGPIAGAGLPFLAIGYGAYWLVKRRRRTSDGPKAIKILPLTG